MRSLFSTSWYVLLAGATLTAASVFTEVHAEDSDKDETTYVLKYQFEPNQFTHLQVTHKSTITTSFGEAQETTVNESVTSKHFRVVSVDADGTAVLEPVIDHVQMTARFGDREPVLFDSAWSVDKIPARFQGIKKTIGRPAARFRVTAAGRLESVKRLQSSGGPDDAASPAAQTDPSQNFLVVLPETPVRVGDTWTESFTTRVKINNEIQREVELLRSYRLKSVKDDVAEITMVTSVIDPIRKPAIRAQLMQRELAGTIRFDMVRGLIVNRDSAVNKTVFDCFGPKSSMRAVSQRIEKRIEPSVAQAGETSAN